MAVTFVDQGDGTMGPPSDATSSGESSQSGYLLSRRPATEASDDDSTHLSTRRSTRFTETETESSSMKPPPPTPPGSRTRKPTGSTESQTEITDPSFFDRLWRKAAPAPRPISSFDKTHADRVKAFDETYGTSNVPSTERTATSGHKRADFSVTGDETSRRARFKPRPMYPTSDGRSRWGSSRGAPTSSRMRRRRSLSSDATDGVEITSVGLYPEQEVHAMVKQGALVVLATRQEEGLDKWSKTAKADIDGTKMTLEVTCSYPSTNNVRAHARLRRRGTDDDSSVGYAPSSHRTRSAVSKTSMWDSVADSLASEQYGQSIYSSVSRISHLYGVSRDQVWNTVGGAVGAVAPQFLNKPGPEGLSSIIAASLGATETYYDRRSKIGSKWDDVKIQGYDCRTASTIDRYTKSMMGYSTDDIKSSEASSAIFDSMKSADCSYDPSRDVGGFTFDSMVESTGIERSDDPAESQSAFNRLTIGSCDEITRLRDFARDTISYCEVMPDFPSQQEIMMNAYRSAIPESEGDFGQRNAMSSMAHKMFKRGGERVLAKKKGILKRTAVP